MSSEGIREDSSPPRKRLSLSPMHTRRYFKSPVTPEESKRLIDFLDSTERFYLINHQLMHVRKDINDIWTYLTSLKTLNLSGSFLRTLPDAVSILQHLEDLNLSKNHFSSLPKVVLDLKSLTSLSLNKNEVSELPSLELLEHLETLNLSHNKLTSLPSSFASMSTLKSLDLSFNSFKVIPTCLQRGMLNLEYLNVSSNKRLNLNSAVKSHNLRRFIAKDISYGFAFPKWLFSGKITVFEEINLSRTKFDKVFVTLSKQKTMVKKLSIQNCSINHQQLQKILVNVIGLRHLKIGNKDFMKCRSNLIDQMALLLLMQPEELVELQMRGTNFSIMPKEIENFRNLREIDVGNNHLSWLPEEFCRLKMLEVLKIDDNSLVNLPEGLGMLENLREFRAAGNAIARLPESFKTLKRLEILDLYDNEFRESFEGIEGWEGLVGFDFEMNYASSDVYKQLTKISYETLKLMIRGGRVNYRIDGQKFETPMCSPKSSRTDSDWELLSNSSMSGYCPQSRIYPIDAKTPTESENWDEPEDSSDEFDPNNPQPPRIKVKFTYLDHLKPRFCPNDIHPLPMLQRIAIARAMGDYQPVPLPVEGQFSDAEKD